MNFFRAILLTLLFCVTAQAADGQRWLLIFNTSSAMKKRLPATEAEIGRLLLDSAGGKMQKGDSIGVWMFDEKLRTGQYPLTFWQPTMAAGFTTNLVAFVRQQKYSSDTEFDSLQPMINRVIADSERLTILIFCDGTDQVRWTPYDDGINSTLEQTAAERKKNQQPAVILLRTQMGKYVGATVNFPPSPLNFPAFPPLPRELKPAATNPPAVVTVAPVKPAPPASTAAPLIIVGTHVSTNVDDLTKNFIPTSNIAAPAPIKTNPPSTNAVIPEVAKSVLAATAGKSNIPVAKTSPVIPPATNSLAVKPAMLVSITNPPATTTNLITTMVTTENHFSKTLIGVGVALFLAAALLIGFLAGKRRRPQSSLITSSMQEETPPVKRK